MIKGILFDLDETLLDRTGSIKAFLVEQHMRHPEFSGVGFDEYYERFIALDRRGRTKKSAVYQTILSELSIRSAALAATLLDEYERDFSQFARGFDGLDDILLDLADKHLPVGIVTNGETVFQMRAIHALGLESRVDAILISEQEGIRKPGKQIFLRAVQRLGLAPAECLFVGDNPRADILGAHNAGLSTIWISDGSDWPEGIPENPGHTVQDLSGVLKMLNRTKRSLP